MMNSAASAGTPKPGGIFAGWMRFWFTAADPTPLCFMRIVAGILTLYVHVAYTFDLIDFYGPHGWYDHQIANQNRHGMPHAKTQTDWPKSQEDDSENEDTPFVMPSDPTLRESLVQFMNRLLVDKNYDQITEFMSRLSQMGEDRVELLRYLKELPADRALREQVLNPIAEKGLTPEQMESSIPRVFQRLLDPDQRKQFITTLQRFADLLPDRDPGRSALFNLFIDASPRDWKVLLKFVEDLKKIKPEDREEELKYQETWGVPSSLLHAKGMDTYSPWFHVKDVRWLWTIHGLHLFVIVLFTLGMYTRVTSVMTWLVGLSYINRAQPYLFGQDTMMNLCLLYLMVSPCGAKWSLDRWMARKQAEARGEKLPMVQPSVSAGFIIRVLQVQYCLMYFSAGISKLKGTSWWNFTALFGCLSNAEFAPMHVDAYQSFLYWLCSHRVIWELSMSAATVFTLVTELSFPWLVWTPARPICVAASLLMHTGISILMGLSVFSLFMFALSICWIPADAINWMFDSPDGS